MEAILTKKPEVFKYLTIGIPETKKERVVIVGGGFGGIKLAQQLVNRNYQVVLLDRNNYHAFQPLLYQVATAGLEPDSIAGPLRQLFINDKDFHFRMARVNEIIPTEKKIKTPIGLLTYDHLIIATGSRTNFFENQHFITNSFPLKQIPHALNLRSHLLQNFEKAVMMEDGTQLQSLLNVVVVGGGPTGVEVSGALSELKKHVLPKDYPELDFNKMEIYLIEGQDRLLGGMAEKSAGKAKKYLEKLGVHVILNTFVKDYDGQHVLLSNNKQIASQTLIWGAGVKGNMINGLAEDCTQGSRLVVDDNLRVSGYDDIYAVGDIALQKSEEYPKGHPMVAPVAIQMGKYLGKNLPKISRNEKIKPFRYVDKGSMATVGRNKAVVDLPGKINFGGLLAWFIWMFIHLLSIIGFRNKLIVFGNWVWNYLTYDRGTRLIIRLFLPDGKPREKFGSY